MAKGAVIYEVTLDADADIIKELDAWLKRHMREMRRLPGFRSAKLLPPVALDAGAATTRRVVQYTLASQTDLDNYFRQHAGRMRAQTAVRFGARLRSRRRVLDTQGIELPEATAAAAGTSAPQCLNCGATLTGQFCVNCGQQNHSYAAPLWGVINDFFGNHFGFDTKFFRSILPLLFRPGFLSREYSAGRRIRYINPLRLYIFSSILLFFIAWTFVPQNLVNFNNQTGGSKLINRNAGERPLNPGEQKEILGNPYLSKKQKQAILHAAQPKPTGGFKYNFKGSAGTPEVTFNGASGNMMPEIFGRKINMTKAEFQARITHDFEVYLPKMMFVFLPLVALLLKLFYVRSKRYYMEHLIFTLHNHAFIFVAILCMLLAQLLTKHAPWLTSAATWFKDIVGWYIVVYVFLAMLFYYRQSFFKTLVKFLLIGFIYWVTLVSIFALGVALIFAEVVAV